MTPPADAHARQLALDTRLSFAVAAPAGSGKTGLLTQRMLCLLARADAPEEILCMTFTRKAAGEMRARLVAALVDAQNATPVTNDYQQQSRELALKALARDQQQGWNLIEAPNRLRILTIDSFCRHLASQLAVDAGIGHLPEPSDNPLAAYRLAVQQVFAELENPGPTSAALETLLIHFDNNLARLEDLLLQLLSRREQWLALIFSEGNTRDFLEQALQQLIDETLQLATLQLAERASDIALLADYAAMHLQDKAPLPDSGHCLGLTGLPENEHSELTPWRGIVELLLTKQGEWRKSINKGTGFPTKKDSHQPALADQRKAEWKYLLVWAQQQPELLDTLRDIRALPPASYDEAQWQVLDALTSLLPRLVAELKLIFQQQRASDFSEITLTALQALGSEDEPTDLTLRLDAQIKHILIDEFQDTSSVQFRLLQLLTNGWQNGDGRTLFIVGDGMQSLYSFRNANVGLFLDARKHPIGSLQLQPLDLSVNFRSQANIIHWVNHVFAEAFPPQMDSGRGAVPYRHSDSFKPALDEAAVTIDVMSSDDENSNLLEAEQVAQRALQARQQNPDGSIAILVRGRNHLREILPALRAHNLAWQARDIDPLASAMPVIDLVSLTRALLNPADRIAWLAILRAPWCGLDLHDLLVIATAKIDANPRPQKAQYPLLLLQLLHHRDMKTQNGLCLSPQGQTIIGRVAAVLASAWQQRYRKPLRSWLEGTWMALGGPAALGSDDKQAQMALHQCQQYFDLLENHSRGGVAIDDWPSFQYAVDQLYAEPLADEEPLADQEPSADREPLADGEPSADGKPSADKVPSPPLQIMTIHKSKGLEFDTVIIPGLHRGGASNRHQLLLWRERINNDGHNQLLISPPQKLGTADDALYTHLKREESIKSRLENTRVLYVACTRAIQRLHLLFCQPGKNPPKGSLLAPLWPVLAPHIAVEDDDGPAPDLDHCAITLHSPSQVLDEEQATDAPEAHLFSYRLPAEWRSPFTEKDGDNQFALANIQTSDAATSHTSSLNALPEIAPPDAADQRKIGTLFHRTLRQLVLEGIPHWDATRIGQQQASWAIQIAQAGIIRPEHALEVLNQALEKCLADTEHQWIFNQHPQQSECELALNYLKPNGAMATAIIDRCFISDDSQWIIDYKLSTPAQGQKLDDFLHQQSQLYQPQLALYAQTLGALNNNQSEQTAAKIDQLKAALYFPLLSRLEIVINP
ncbi:MAG: UvrD-helicase domain-containing protein [Gammaproteobacteria bacterium]|nr:UvrD-helicase domain-containing protein [Gammaproteobacteria bacterium]MBQ0838779.1 UvrD-helicase domain-containing protein [Gammaproteobacteria bacterium]